MRALRQFATVTGQCVYFARLPQREGLLKIGVTRRFDRRFALIANAERSDVELLGVIPGADFAVEQDLLKRFRHHRAQGLEFFRDEPEIRAFVATLPPEHRPTGLMYPGHGRRHGHPDAEFVADCKRCIRIAQAVRPATTAPTGGTSATLRPHRLRAWRLRQTPLLTLVGAGVRVGVKHSTWSEWESGSRTPSLEKALAIEDVTGGAVRIEDWGFSGDVRALMKRVA